MKISVLKKLVSLIISVLLCFTLTGCDSQLQELMELLAPEFEETVTTEEKIVGEPEIIIKDGKTIITKNPSAKANSDSSGQTTKKSNKKEDESITSDSSKITADDNDEEEVIITNDDEAVVIIDNDTPELKSITIMRDWGPYASGKNAAHDNFNNHLKKIEKYYNIAIVEKKWKATLEGRTLAGLEPEGHLYLVGNSGGNIYNLAVKGIIAPLDDAMKATGITMKEEHYNEYSTQLSNLNGKQWAIGVGFPRVKSAILFNTKITKAAGYDIYDLVNKNQWTWEKMTEIARATTVRNNAGDVTQWGIGIGDNGIKGMIVSNGGHIIHPNSNGKFVSQVNTENTLQAIEQVYNWYNVDKVASSFSDSQWSSISKSFVNGKVAMIFAGHSEVSDAFTGLTGSDYGVAYLPRGPQKSKYVAYMASEYSYVIPACYENVSAQLLTVADALHDWPVEGYNRDDQFRDEWTRYFHNSQQYNMWRNLYYNTNLERVWDGSDRVDLGTGTFNGIITGSTTPAVWMNVTNSNITNYAKDIENKYTYTGSLK